MNDEELSAQLRQATRHRASERLRASVHTQLTLQTAAREAAPEAVAPRRRWPLVLAGFAAGVMLTVGLTAGLSLGWPSLLTPEVAGSGWTAEVVSGHVRALQVGPLTEVASSDRHTVKPWFQGRLDFAPAVPDLADEGYPLLGGRVDHLGGRTAAALVYTRRLHVVHVFTWLAAATQEPVSAQLRGFNVQHWSDGGLQTWVVSDMDAAELDHFAHLWRERSGSKMH